MKIIIADDHGIFRSSLSFLISNKTDHSVVAEIESLEQIIPCVQSTPADLLLVDYHMPGGDSLEKVEYIKHRYENLKIVFLTGTQSGVVLKHIAQSHVDGVLHKEEDAEDILKTMDAVFDGAKIISTLVQSRIESADIDLTRREFEILCLIMKGKSSAEIGALVNVAARTVDKHKENIMKKAGVSNVVQLVELGHKMRLLEVD